MIHFFKLFICLIKYNKCIFIDRSNSVFCMHVQCTLCQCTLGLVNSSETKEIGCSDYLWLN